MTVRLATDPEREGCWYARSETQPGVVYHIQSTADGKRAVCNCLGFRSHGSCKHSREVMFRMAESYDPGAQSRALALRDEEERNLVPIEVAPPKRLLPTMQELDVMSRLAKNLSSARGFAVPNGVDHPAKAFAIIYAGHEVGIGPMMAFRHISVVNGQTQFDAQLMMGICRARDASVEFLFHERSAKGCKVELKRRGESVITVDYREEDAKRANQSGKKGPWTEHPDLMYAYAAVKRAIKLGCPDLAMAIDPSPAVMAETLMPEETVPARESDEWGQLPAPREGAPANVDKETGEVLDMSETRAKAAERNPLHPEPFRDETETPLQAFWQGIKAAGVTREQAVELLGHERFEELDADALSELAIQLKAMPTAQPALTT